ncbi:MAG TPA: FAD-dependent oxidoreductase, partial [Solirubrobacterales bacterium]|nr:FAD-dependent oxidoreductase [Solirubrobacterales bacterium]
MPNATEREVDLVVVGAGAIGLACAWRAAQRGLTVRVLERGAAGSGASGVAAGMLAPVGEATWGEERLLALAQSSHAAWPRF